MHTVWNNNLELYCRIAADKTNRPTSLAVVFSQSDAEYWANRFNRATFCKSPRSVMCIPGSIEKGNFFTSISAYSSLLNSLHKRGLPAHNTVIEVLIGKGLRLSPFTQALGNYKAAFPLPFHLEQGEGILSVAQLSEFCASGLFACMTNAGFTGVLIHWADEILIPGIDLPESFMRYKDADVIRLMMKKSVSEDLAKNKEWLVAHRLTGSLQYELARQDPQTLIETLERHRECLIGVNLGTSAVSHEFMDVLGNVFGGYAEKPSAPIDWDPYFWLALLSDGRADWDRQRDYEVTKGRTGIVSLEKNYPDFFHKARMVRKIFENRHHRSPNILALDLGEAFWIDMGSHLSLTDHLLGLLRFDDIGRFTRRLYRIPGKRDKNGNTVIRSQVCERATIRNSLIVDASISGESSLIDGGIIIGGSYGTVKMPRGGNALFSVVGHLSLEDASCMGLRLLAEEARIPASGRSSTVPLNGTRTIITVFENMEHGQGHFALPMELTEATDQISRMGMPATDSWYNSSARELASRLGILFPENGL